MKKVHRPGWRTKLSEGRVRAILVGLKRDVRVRRLAEDHGVSRQTIYDIANGKSWAWIEWPDGG